MPGCLPVCLVWCVTDLRVLGALEPLVTLLGPDHPPELQAGAAHVLGTAASNNEKLAAELVRDHPQLLQLLLQVGLHTAVGWS